MAKNTQEYINQLINKERIFHLDISTPSSVSQCEHCNKKNWNKPDPNLTGEIEDLSEFKNLRGINASNNNFTKLENLFTLPNKDKMKHLNFFGNKIQEVDLAKLFTEFPKLEWLNLDYNPVSAKNLASLTPEQFNKLVDGMKSKKIKFSSHQGTILADLLEYAQWLIKKGDNSQREQAHRLQVILQNSPVKNREQGSNNSKTPWVIGGVEIISLSLIFGYLLGKRRKEKELLD